MLNNSLMAHTAALIPAGNRAQRTAEAQIRS